ncbi:unnamed protein product [Albugo candida]|uniref:Uncharacterized protein n=1 Tax=Albugo candida TaxID=65357 RepID=A0A024G0T2_9STRA|nr:unnamed protein product [Albugo candida]|eukprot:CCI39895.1 unnamed protein product [Albugo candida]
MNLAMVPALCVMQRNYRHFELFIGIYYFIISVMFSVAESFETSSFFEQIGLALYR